MDWQPRNSALISALNFPQFKDLYSFKSAARINLIMSGDKAKRGGYGLRNNADREMEREVAASEISIGQDGSHRETLSVIWILHLAVL